MKKQLRIVKATLIAIGMVGMISNMGCASSNNVAENPVMMTPQPQEVDSTEPPINLSEGSIYREASTLNDLFINPKARRIGDIITIKIVESSTAKNNAATNTGRKSSVLAQMNSFFNLENQYNPEQDSFNPFGAIEGGLESDFEGSGTTARSGDLSAFITAKVVDVSPNGNLSIKGVREVQINHEKQYIILQGIVRPRDISADNVILSTYISDAKIAYSGSGIVDKRQRPGWMANILDVVWPF
jgi:flagellar L-ring protein FlgH